jgi:hypothetical protein
VVARKIKICEEADCKNVQSTKRYCRLHYLKNWKKVKEQEGKKSASKLNRYVEGIVKKHPDRYMEVIRKDLSGRGELDFEEGSAGAASNDDVEEVLHDLGYPDEDTLNNILSRIKIDKAF